MISGYSKAQIKLADGRKMPLAQLLGELPEVLKPLAGEVKARFAKLGKDSAQGHYQIGQLIQREIARIEVESRAQGRSTYGLRVFDRLAVEADVHPRVLRDCVQAAERFSPEVFQTQIVDRGLTWSHASLLAGVADSKKRQKLIDKTLADRLSADELGHLIVGKEPKKPHGPGHSPAKPRGLPQGLDRLRSGSKVYRNILGVLFGAAFDILTKIQESPPDSLTQQVRDAVAECADHLAAVEQTVQNASQRLKAGMEWIDNCIAAQGEHEKTAQAEEDEERHRGRRTPARAR